MTRKRQAKKRTTLTFSTKKEDDDDIFTLSPRKRLEKLNAALSVEPDDAGAGKQGLNTLNTLLGVGFPCLANILGVLLFLRLAYFVGTGGLVVSSALLLLCAATTTLTTLSMSAVATNGRVAGGGSYYLTSRALSAEIGTAVGLLFSLGTTLAAAMYVIGAAELAHSTFFSETDPVWFIRVASVAILAVLLTFVFISIRAATYAGVVALVAVLASILLILIALFASSAARDDGVAGVTGFAASTARANALPASDASAASLLALYFPAFTGIMAGANRSDALSSPSRSIPRGTLGAIAATTTLYLIMSLLLGVTIERSALRDVSRVLVAELASPLSLDMVVRGGILLSTLGAGLQSLIGAPRLLAFIASDNVLPLLSPFRVDDRDGAEPRRALALCGIICFVALMAGSLEAITPLVSLAFLLSYASINVAAFVHSALRLPSWRPSFKTHWSLSALGALMCLTLMFIISWWAALIIVFIATALYVLVQQKGNRFDWSDGGGIDSLKRAVALYILRSLPPTPRLARNWRPNILAVLKPGDDTIGALALVRALKGGAGAGGGVTLIARVVHVPNAARAVNETEKSRAELVDCTREAKIDAFAVTVAATTSIGDGVRALIQCSGFPPSFSPNTVLMPWMTEGDREQRRDFFDTLQLAHALKRTLLLTVGIDAEFGKLHAIEDVDGETSVTVDLYWVGGFDGSLLLVFAHLLRRSATGRSRAWKKARIRLFTVATPKDNSVAMERALRRLVSEARVEAEVSVIELDESSLAPYVNERTVGLAERAELLKSLQGLVNEATEPSLIAKSAHESTSTSTAAVLAGSGGVAHAKQQITIGIQLNGLIHSHSSDASLVLLNLPKLPKRGNATRYAAYVDTLIDRVPRALLVLGSGEEVVTTYN